MMTRILTGLLLTCCLPAVADVALENYGGTTLDEISKHTVTINTFADQLIVFDADNQRVLGTISLGSYTNALEIDRKKSVIHAAETYLSRHTRGERTDVVTTYDINTLSAVSEIVIPPKHAGGYPMRHYTGIIRDGDVELMLVVNITPAVSVSVVDLGRSEFTGEIMTAGCGLVYPSDGLSFLQLCGDGTAQHIRLGPDGSEQARVRSDVFFDLQVDPLMEKGVRTPGGWVFNTFKGDVFKVSVSEDKIVTQKLFQITDEANSWRVGGLQPLAYHTGNNLLLALMHQGGEATHKDPGTEVWYYDLTTGRRVHRLTLANLTTSIQVSQDDDARIYAGSTITSELVVYNLRTGNRTGGLTGLPLPTILQNL